MQEPGLDRHDWETEWQGLEGSLADAPLETLPELGALIARMLEARGFALVEHEGEAETEPETMREFAEARRITQLADSGERVDPGDIGLAVQAYRNLYAYLLELGPTSDAPV